MSYKVEKNYKLVDYLYKDGYKEIGDK